MTRYGRSVSKKPILTLSPLNGTFEKKDIVVPFFPDVVVFARKTNPSTTPTPCNGFFDAKVLSRHHAEIWADRSGKIWIRDVKSSNGTFINGTRLSLECQESDPHLLQAQDILELGIDIVDEDQKIIVHHKVLAKVETAGLGQGEHPHQEIFYERPMTLPKITNQPDVSEDDLVKRSESSSRGRDHAFSHTVSEDLNQDEVVIRTRLCAIDKVDITTHQGHNAEMGGVLVGDEQTAQPIAAVPETARPNRESLFTRLRGLSATNNSLNPAVSLPLLRVDMVDIDSEDSCDSNVWTPDSEMASDSDSDLFAVEIAR